MADKTLRIRLDQLANALDRLHEMAVLPDTHAGRIDALIQRFEFCFELCWKALKAALLQEGHDTTSPRDAFKKAYAMGWLQDETVWLTMLTDRNETSHTYHEAKAADIAGRIPAHASNMKVLHAVLTGKVAA